MGGVRECFCKVQPGAGEALQKALAKSAGALVSTRSLFDEIDVDGSGTLNRKEVQALCHRLHLPVTRSELNEAMKLMDSDNSGQVDYGELIGCTFMCLSVCPGWLSILQGAADEFAIWWKHFQSEHKKHKKKTPLNPRTPSGVDAIEFSVFLSRHGLGTEAAPAHARPYSCSCNAAALSVR
jgi:hypothetical protein